MSRQVPAQALDVVARYVYRSFEALYERVPSAGVGASRTRSQGVHPGDPVAKMFGPWSPWSENFNGMGCPALTEVAVGYAEAGAAKPPKSYTTLYVWVSWPTFPARS